MRSSVALVVVVVACGGASDVGAPTPSATPSPSTASSPSSPSPPSPPSPGQRAWQLDDVSMLLPFPADGDLPKLLTPATAGARGPLIAPQVLDRVPRPFVVNVPDAEAFAKLRAIAIRLDPCFRRPGDQACHTLVRMSWQPFVGGRAVDAALHSFYELAPADFGKLADELWRLREAAHVDTSGPLGVHPILAAQGYGGTYWSGLRDALLAYCGEKSFVRLTTMQLSGRTNVWMWSGVERNASGAWAPMTIARIDAPMQTIAVHAQPPTVFDGGLYRTKVDEADRLEPREQPEFDAFLRGTAGGGVDVKDTAKLGKVLDSVRFLETPSEASTSETIDCASCHIAQAARVWIGKWAPTAHAAGPAFAASGFDLSNGSPLAGLTNQLRAFGYIQTKPVISQRVINESAVVAERMRKL